MKVVCTVTRQAEESLILLKGFHADGTLEVILQVLRTIEESFETIHYLLHKLFVLRLQSGNHVIDKLQELFRKNPT